MKLIEKPGHAHISRGGWSILNPDYTDSVTALRPPKKMTIAKWLQRSLKGFTEVTTRSPIGCRTKLVASKFFWEHATGCNWFGLSEVSWASEKSARGLIFIRDWFPTLQGLVPSRQGWGLCGKLSMTEQNEAVRLHRLCTIAWVSQKWNQLPRVCIIWTASSEFGTYRLCEQRRFRRACASAQSRQNLRCSLIQAVSQEEPSDRKPDPWPLWMAGHAQLKFVMTECSKTQIRLTGLISWSHCLCNHIFKAQMF